MTRREKGREGGAWGKHQVCDIPKAFSAMIPHGLRSELCEALQTCLGLKKKTADSKGAAALSMKISNRRTNKIESLICTL